MDPHLKQLPSRWIINRVKAISNNKELQILDFASGNGIHSKTLANNKRKITAVDNDNVKLSTYKNYQNIKTICFDLETEEDWPLKNNYYDIVIVTNYLYRPKIKKIGDLIKENGYLFYETFARGNERYGKPTNPNFLLKNRELIKTFQTSFKILYYFNGHECITKKSIIQRCAIKKTLPNRKCF